MSEFRGQEFPSLGERLPGIEELDAASYHRVENDGGLVW